MDTTVSFFVGLLLSLAGFALVSGGQGKCPRVGINLALVLPGRTRCLHLHHWMLGTALALFVVLVVCLSGGTLTPLLWGLLGVCAGAVLSGLLYDDAMDIVQPCARAQPC